MPPDATTVLRVDWKAARASPLYARLLAEARKLGLLDPKKPHCFVLPDAVDELVIAMRGDRREEAFLAMRIHDESVVRGCMPELAKTSSDPPVAGRAAVVLSDGQRVVLADGLVVAGSRPDLEAALSPARRSSGLPPTVRGLDVRAGVVLSLHREGVVLSLHREGPGYFGGASPVSIVVEAGADHLAIRASGTMPSPEEAAALLLRATTMRDEIARRAIAGADDDTRALQAIVAGARLSADGARVHGEIEVEGGESEQRRLALLILGAAAAKILAPPPPSEEPVP